MPSLPPRLSRHRTVSSTAGFLALVVSLGTAVEVRAATGHAATTGFCGVLGRLWSLGDRVAHGDLGARAGQPCGGLQVWDLVFLAVVALVLVAAIRFRHLTVQRRLELARRMVERGLEPPGELWGASPAGDLRRGVVLVCAGLGLLVTSYVSARPGLAPAGLIPGFIGLGYLLSYRFASGRRSS